MAVNVGNISAHSKRSFRAGAALTTHAYPQIKSLTPSAKKWTHRCTGAHLVHTDTQHALRKVLTKSHLLLGLHCSSSPKFSKSTVAAQVKTNSRIEPPQDTGDVTLSNADTIEDLPFTSISQKTPTSEKLGELVKSSVPLHQLRHGEFLENQKLYRQKFVIRSYEVGADKATSITTMVSFFQVSAYWFCLSSSWPPGWERYGCYSRAPKKNYKFDMKLFATGRKSRCVMSI